MSLQARLAALLGIRPDERRLVALLIAQSLCVGVVWIFTSTAADTLFIVTFGAQNLPYLYLGSAIATALSGALYTRLVGRLPLAALLRLTLVGLLVVLIALRAALALPDQRWPVAAVAIWSVLQAVLLNLAFWGLASHFLNVRQGKRLYGLIGSGEIVTTIVGGALVPLLVRVAGIENLLLLAAAGLVGALLCQLAVTGPVATAEAMAPAAPPREATGPLRQLLASRYVLLIFAFTALAGLAYYVVDIAFYDQAAARYPDEVQLASFLGAFGAVMSLLTLASRAFISGPLVNRYGVLAGLLAWPAFVALGSAAAIGAGVLADAGTAFFWLAALTKLLDGVLSSSIFHTSFQLLYQPLPAEQRLGVQTATESIVEPVAGAAAGLLLLLLIGGMAFGAMQILAVATVILLAMLAVGIWLGRAYPGALLGALAGRRLSPGSLAATDPDSLAALRQAVHSPQPGTALYALDRLETEPETLAALLPDLLVHPTPEVRAAALERIERLHLPALATAVRGRVAAEPVEFVRGAALRALAAIGGAAALGDIEPLLDAPEPGIRRGALVGLLRSGGIEGVLLAGERLLALVRSAAESERVLAAQVLGDVGVGNFHRPLLPLLVDERPGVRIAALGAAAKLRHRDLWPPAIAALATPATAPAAAIALVAAGPAVLPLLGEALAGADTDRVAKRHLAQIAGRIGGAEAMTLLARHLRAPDVALRAEVLATLARGGYRATGRATDVSAQLAAELDEAATLTAALLALGEDGATALLRDALDYRLAGVRDRLLLLLSFIHDGRAVLRARDALLHPSGEQRAYALEALDTLVAHERKGAILAVLDDLPPAERLRRLGGAPVVPNRDALLREMVADPRRHWDAWLRACAVHTIAQSAPAPDPSLLALALADPDGLVRETAARLRGRAAAVSTNAPTDAFDGLTGRIERILALRGVGLFADVPHELLLAVAAGLVQVAVRAGEVIVVQGDPGTSLYLIVAGEVEVATDGRVLDRLGPGAVFGEGAALSTAPRAATVTALNATHLFRLEQEVLYAAMGEHPAVLRAILRVLSIRLRERSRDVAQLGARLAELQAATPAASRARAE